MLKVGWNIVNNDSNSASNRLQGLSLINDCYMFLMDVEVITSPFTSNFESVGQYFQSFEPIQDEKVIQIMRDRNLFL